MGLKDLNYTAFEISRQFQPTLNMLPQTALPFPTWYLESKDNYQLGTSSKDKNKSPALPFHLDDMLSFPLLFLVWLAH